MYSILIAGLAWVYSCIKEWKSAIESCKKTKRTTCIWWGVWSVKEIKSKSSSLMWVVTVYLFSTDNQLKKLQTWVHRSITHIGGSNLVSWVCSYLFWLSFSSGVCVANFLGWLLSSCVCFLVSKCAFLFELGADSQHIIILHCIKQHHQVMYLIVIKT